MEIILEDAKFMWSKKELKHFKALWEQGLDIYEIAEWMNEEPDDIALLVIDQAQKEIIQRRNRQQQNIRIQK